jgi:hypothetical protein
MNFLDEPSCAQAIEAACHTACGAGASPITASRTIVSDTCLLKILSTPVGPEIHCFRGSIPILRLPLSTFYSTPCGSTCMTREQSDSLILLPMIFANHTISPIFIGAPIVNDSIVNDSIMIDSIVNDSIVNDSIMIDSIVIEMVGDFREVEPA